MGHVPVLLDKVMELLDVSSGKIFIDATADGGGHTAAILERLPADGVLLGIDQDESMVRLLKEKFEDEARAEFICGNFRNIDELAGNYAGRVDGVLYDLGYSSLQLEGSGRGFSFLKEEPLVMTLKSRPDAGDLTADKIINTWREDELAAVIRELGEERFAGRIARNITEARRRKKIKTTAELAEIIRRAVPKNYERGRIHPATRTFQALRIVINDELEALTEGLEGGWALLAPEGRMVVISFHSLEDRIVKNFFRDKKKNREAEVFTKKPIVPDAEEIKNNPRARSAKLRAAKKLMTTDS